MILQRVSEFQRTGRSLIEIKLRLSENQSAQVTRLMEDLKCAERDNRFEWTWVEITLYKNAVEVTDSIINGSLNQASVIHLIAKRSLKANYRALDVYNSLMKPPPKPPLNSHPIIIPPPPAAKKKDRVVDSSSDSDSDSTSWSSDSSVGQVRRRLRRHREKKTKQSLRRFDSDSDSDSDAEEQDVIAIKLRLKRGDDIVKILLDKWTAEVEGKGKGKEAVA